MPQPEAARRLAGYTKKNGGGEMQGHGFGFEEGEERERGWGGEGDTVIPMK